MRIAGRQWRMRIGLTQVLGAGRIGALAAALLAAASGPSLAQVQTHCLPTPGGGFDCTTLDTRTGRMGETTVRPSPGGSLDARTQDYGTGSLPRSRLGPSFAGPERPFGTPPPARADPYRRSYP